ncbi:MAG: alpha/beta hydrolase fold domain-containing protein [Selenomonadaceae bacterium]|nr:alpha/beta hydrolase fold domain-containing protein [Selenomonadaceae bacterium]
MFESKILYVPLTQAKIHFVPDVVYAQVPTFESPNQLLQMDLLIPQIKRKLPTVIFVTGGRFISANRARMPQLRMYLAEKNFVVASINYRTVPNAKFPQPVEDVKSAIRFLKANAQRFSVDPEKICVVGDSAGGYLAAFAAVTNNAEMFNVGENLHVSSEIVAAVDLYGPSDLTQIAATFPVELQNLYNSASSVTSLFVNGMPAFGGVDGGILAHPVAAERANPINYITKNSAPMLLMHGTNDSVVSPAQTDLLFQALISQDIEAERYLIPNAGHADEHWQQESILAVIAEFLLRHVI